MTGKQHFSVKLACTSDDMLIHTDEPLSASEHNCYFFESKNVTKGMITFHRNVTRRQALLTAQAQLGENVQRVWTDNASTTQ